VEDRTAFLDPVVAEFGFRLPDPLKATTGMAKRLLRDWLFLNLPAALRQEEGYHLLTAAMQKTVRAGLAKSR